MAAAQESRGGSPSGGGLKKIFAGVRFVLSGFDPFAEARYRSELVHRGGVDVERVDQCCTHVIVFRCVYDDPVCVAARQSGKIVVTEMWVDDCVFSEMLVDANRVLYRPVKALNGISGSEGLCICLTGYQRQEREDIMKMVSLMGARFSKPLIANQVTHLICYKFEGEKYELAKKVKIKLVNHRWLEDCLKEWEILPLDNYTKSGWELEVLEAEARDSEEETEDARRVPLGRRSIIDASSMPINKASDMSISTAEKFKVQQDTKEAKQLYNVEDLVMKNGLLSTPCKATGSGKALDIGSPSNKVFEAFDRHFNECMMQSCHDNLKVGDLSGGKVSVQCNVDKEKEVTMLYSEKACKRVSPTSAVDEKFRSLSYSRKNRKKLDSPGTPLNNQQTSPPKKLEQNKLKSECSVSPWTSGEDHPSSGLAMPIADNTHYKESPSSSLPQKRKASASRAGSTSKAGYQDAKACPRHSPVEAVREACPQRSPAEAARFLQLEFSTASPEVKIDQGHASTNTILERVAVLNSSENRQSVASKPKYSSYKKRSLKLGQPLLGSNPSSILKPEDAKLVDVPSNTQSRQVLNEQLNTVNDLPPMEARTGDGTISSTNDCVMQDLRHFGQKQTENVIKSIKNTTDCLEMLPTDRRTEISQRVKEVGSSLHELWESKLVSRFDCGVDSALSHMPDLTSKEPGNPQGMQDEAVSPSVSRDSKIRELSGVFTDGTRKENKTKAMSGAQKKKVASENKLNWRRKPNMRSIEKDKGMTCSDETATTNKAAVESSEEGKANPELEPEKVTVSAKHNIVDSLSNQEVRVEDQVEVAHRPVSGTDIKNVTTNKEADNEKIRVAESPSSESKIKKTSLDQDTSIDPEKENKPKENSDLTRNFNHCSNYNVLSKPKRKSAECFKNLDEDSSNAKQTNRCLGVINPKPSWFVLSGHRAQRKEFQMLIRRLKGRLCRDSHHWSYQATHFIVPDPIRRTEKFFAAAASGRWILKTDYLTASHTARKFLDEEPFEWYHNGLTEDGAISLEAPRKWRLLRERTGHGAFYGMKIVIYGDCIAPSLDTLKRVVKAGDGTILATAPPYTRFLQSGVDYAIISPGMPRVDVWVQEFLRNEIPCVLADYLVEFVCKPGHSLERHVLYNTHAWAEKSYGNLLRNLEEIITESSTTSGESAYDLSCSICGSRDRGEVMLICGDKDGGVGCGVGAHMDCCDPPLETVPQGGWFCPKCSTSRSSKKPSHATIKSKF